MYAGSKAYPWESAVRGSFLRPREHQAEPEKLEPAVGLSPRLRRAQQDVAALRVPAGIIPAYAGSTPWSGQPMCSDGDHPRVCGEHPAYCR